VVSLQNKILILLFLVFPLTLWGQDYFFTFTDPCTLTSQTLSIPQGSNSITLSYFDNIQTFTQNDFVSGGFDNWVNNVAQINSFSPCENITQVIVNSTNGTSAATTLNVVTNIMSSIGGGMLPPAGSINNSTNGGSSINDNNEEQENQTDGNDSNQPKSTEYNQTNSNNQETQGNQPLTQTNGGSNTQTNGGSGGTNQSTQGGEQTTQSSVGNQSNTTSESTGGSSTQSTANSLSNAIDGGGGNSGGSKNKKSNKAQKNAGSLIASGDVVVISNQDNSNSTQVRFVGSMTHSNTNNTRIKGGLLTYTSGINNVSLTFYKSWINPKRTFNLVLANTTMSDFTNNLLNTTTTLASFRFGEGKLYTGMLGGNLTYGKLGERNLTNLSSIYGVHRNYRVSPRITTSLLVLGVYSPFTQFYDGKWWEEGMLVVPFSSWDIRITKTFKYNISFTGVYHTSGNFLNYQVLTGGKLNF